MFKCNICNQPKSGRPLVHTVFRVVDRPRSERRDNAEKRTEIEREFDCCNDCHSAICGCHTVAQVQSVKKQKEPQADTSNKPTKAQVKEILKRPEHQPMTLLGVQVRPDKKKAKKKEEVKAPRGYKTQLKRYYAEQEDPPLTDRQEATVVKKKPAKKRAKKVRPSKKGDK